MKLNFSLRIDDEEHSLSATKGISIQYISDLLKDLYKAIDMNEGANCTLSSIRGNCYALDFTTDTESHYERFKIIHKNIEILPPIHLAEEERKYYDTLKRVLKDKYALRAYDNERKEIASIKNIGKEIEIDYYYSTKTVYGVVSELGGKQLTQSKKHIRIHGVNYQISISKDMDMQLKEYYGSAKLRIKVLQKRLTKSNKIVSAELQSFDKISDKKISENLKEEGYIDLEIIKGVKNIDDIIDILYGTSS